MKAGARTKHLHDMNRQAEWAAETSALSRPYDSTSYCSSTTSLMSRGVRLIEPYGYGIHKNGNEHLTAWQTRGASASGEHEGWKTFLVDEIEQLEVLAETFDGVRRDYNPSRPVAGAKRGYAYYWPRRRITKE